MPRPIILAAFPWKHFHHRLIFLNSEMGTHQVISRDFFHIVLSFVQACDRGDPSSSLESCNHALPEYLITISRCKIWIFTITQ